MTSLEPTTLRQRVLVYWKRWQRLPLLMIFTSVLAAFGIVQTTFQIGHMVYRSITWSKEYDLSQQQVKQLQRDIRILNEAQTALKSESYMHELARCQGFVDKDEQVIVDLKAQVNAQLPGENCAMVRIP